MKHYAIILASGTGSRSGLVIPKQFYKVAGKTILEHTLDSFEKHPHIDAIIVVSHRDYTPLCESLILKNHYCKVQKLLTGGNTRQESSYIGISCIQEQNAKVLIHDAVRPFLSREIIDRCLTALDTYKAVNVAIPSYDTLIEVDEHSFIKNIPNRENFRRGQTPQCFDLQTIQQAHKMALQAQDQLLTDDCGLVLKYTSEPIFVVDGNDFNHKVTTPVDVAIADKLFQLKRLKSMALEKEKLQNQVIVVFGASQGIGQAIVELGTQNQAKIYGFSRSEGTDIANYSDIDKAFSQVLQKEKRIDAIVITAGVLNMGKIQCRDILDIETEIRVNYLACVYIAQKAHPHLAKSRGSLLFFASSSYTRGRALYATYSSIKAALVNLVQALSEEWEADGIRVNIINPERTATPMRTKSFGQEPPETLLDSHVVAEASLATITSPITGQVIHIKRETS